MTIEEEKAALEARIAQIDAAITNALTAKSYSAYGRSKTNAELKDLREFRAETKAELDALERGSSNTLLIKRGIPAC